jgi:hypothetical protein
MYTHAETIKQHTGENSLVHLVPTQPCSVHLSILHIISNPENWDETSTDQSKKF